MPICSRSSTWACVLGASVIRASVAAMARLRRRSAPEETSCFCRGDGAPFSTARFWEVGRYSSSLSARRRRARRGGRPRPRARQHKTVERCKTPSSVHTGSHQIGIAERGQEPCSRRKLSCAARSARCAMSQHRSAGDVANAPVFLLLLRALLRQEALAFFCVLGEGRLPPLDEERRRPSFNIVLESTANCRVSQQTGWLPIFSCAVTDLDLFGPRGSSTGPHAATTRCGVSATDTYPL